MTTLKSLITQVLENDTAQVFLLELPRGKKTDFVRHARDYVWISLQHRLRNATGSPSRFITITFK